MKKHTVTRTWMRKDGTVITKTYSYGQGKSRRGKTLITKSGKLNKKNINAYKAEIDANTKLNPLEKRTLKNDLDVYLKQRLIESKNKANRRLTTTGFEGWLGQTKIETMLANAGYSTEDAAAELGISEADILDESRWSNDEFTSASGAKYKFKFQYTGSAFERV